MLRALLTRFTLALVLVPALVVISACGGTSGDAASPAADDPGPEHVHAIGVDPADGSLYIGTHTGLYRMTPDSQTAARVGDHRQDTMGFIVTGPNRFLGSGHPDLRDDLPPLLGLIESSDAGLSWSPVSLLGKADFHSLRAHGSQVVGYDASGGRLMVSADGGRTWRSSVPPADLADLVVDPADPARFVAASADGLIGSSDAGRHWSPLEGAPILLAWPAHRALYAFAADGTARVSADGGGAWATRATLPGEPAAVTAVGADGLIAALHDGTFASSDDGGRSWSSGPWTASDA
jgi:hypothetical protein